MRSHEKRRRCGSHHTHSVTGARVAARGSRERESASKRLPKPRDRHTGCKVTTRRAAQANRVSPSQEGSRPGTPNVSKVPQGCSACRGKGRSRPSAHLTLAELGKPHGVSCMWLHRMSDQPGRVPDKKGFIPQEAEEPRRSESWPVMGQIGLLLETDRTTQPERVLTSRCAITVRFVRSRSDNSAQGGRHVHGC